MMKPERWNDWWREEKESEKTKRGGNVEQKRQRRHTSTQRCDLKVAEAKTDRLEAFEGKNGSERGVGRNVRVGKTTLDRETHSP